MDRCRSAGKKTEGGFFEKKRFYSGEKRGGRSEKKLKKGKGSRKGRAKENRI